MTSSFSAHFIRAELRKRTGFIKSKLEKRLENFNRARGVFEFPTLKLPLSELIDEVLKA